VYDMRDVLPCNGRVKPCSMRVGFQDEYDKETRKARD